MKVDTLKNCEVDAGHEVAGQIGDVLRSVNSLVSNYHEKIIIDFSLSSASTITKIENVHEFTYSDRYF